MQQSYRIIALLVGFGLACSVGTQEQPPPFGPTIARNEVQQGPAWDAVEHTRSGLPIDSPTAFSVEASESDLHMVRVEPLDMRSAPLGPAAHYLHEATRAVRQAYKGGDWMIRPMKFDGPSRGIAIRVYETPKELLKKIGIKLQECVSPTDFEDNPWPKNNKWAAEFLPQFKQLSIHADTAFQEDVAALPFFGQARLYET